jgi:glycosyltransferase involved in cell wall biosynthesis
MKIAVDASALFGPNNGIRRYLRELLPHVIPASAGSWVLLGRDTLLSSPLGDVSAAIALRADHLPPAVGRVLSLATSQPYWAWRDAPDLFFGPAHRLPLWLPAATACVVTIHDLCWLKAPQTMRRTTRWLDATLMPRALLRADRIIAVSKATGDDLCNAFPTVAGRVVVVQEAAASLPPPLPAEALASCGLSGRYILFVGTREPRKNLLRLLDAFAYASKQATEPTMLAIAGIPGWGGEDIEAHAAKLGIADRVCPMGAVDDATLATLYRHAHFLAMPSLYEGFGVPLLEAMVQGTPVLTSHSSSMPEVAGDAGLLVDPLSTEDIARGLLQLLNEPDLRNSLASKARAQAANFSWARAAHETLTVFTDARRAGCTTPQKKLRRF